jgi:hypothetical protein
VPGEASFQDLSSARGVASILRLAEDDAVSGDGDSPILGSGRHDSLGEVESGDVWWYSQPPR